MSCDSLFATPRRRPAFTLYEVLIYAIVLAEPGVAHSGGHRIDLNTVSLLPNGKAVSISEREQPLFGPDLVVTLKPGEAESFRFGITKPNIAHNLHVIFSLAARYHDERGRRRVALSDRICRVIVDDREGFRSADLLEWNATTLTELQKTYIARIEGRGLPSR